MKLMVPRQIIIMVVSMLVVAIALAAKVQPCDEKEEKKNGLNYKSNANEGKSNQRNTGVPLKVHKERL